MKQTLIVQDTWTDFHEVATTQEASTSHKERAKKVTSDGACRSGSRGMIFNCRLLLPSGYKVHINVHTTLQNTKFVYIFVERLENSFEFLLSE